MQSVVAHPQGEQPSVEVRSAIAETFADRVHIEWGPAAPVTVLGQLPFFIDFLKQAGLLDAWVGDCPLVMTSPNAPKSATCLAPCCCRCCRGIAATLISPRCAATR
jgi:hypothetical protein